MPAIRILPHPVRWVFRTLSLARSDPQVLWATLNRSGSEVFAAPNVGGTSPCGDYPAPVAPWLSFKQATRTPN